MPGHMERVAAGRAFGVKILCQIIQMLYNDESMPDRLRPGLPATASGVARQGTYENYATAGFSKNKRRKACEEAAGTVEEEMHTHKGWYLKYTNNDCKGKRAGRHDGGKE